MGSWRQGALVPHYVLSSPHFIQLTSGHPGKPCRRSEGPRGPTAMGRRLEGRRSGPHLCCVAEILTSMEGDASFLSSSPKVRALPRVRSLPRQGQGAVLTLHTLEGPAEGPRRCSGQTARSPLCSWNWLEEGAA